MLKKDYSPNGATCTVTFILPREADARSAYVVGDFNNWLKDATPMSRNEDGTWIAAVTLEAGHEYQYRYFINGTTWYNDPQADRYMAHPYGGENSVVVT